MKVITLLLGSGLVCTTLAAGTLAVEAAARERVVCFAKTSNCVKGVASRTPIPGKNCQMLNKYTSKYRGTYFCT